MSEQNPEGSLTLQPWAGRVEFRLGLPGSKSLTLRDCAIAALADGESKIAAQKEVALAQEAMLNGKMGACGMHLSKAIHDAGMAK